MQLVFYPDTEPGISRRRRGRGFTYLAADGTRIGCRTKRAELEAVAVPPAYEDVWFSPIKNGHLRATGRDQKERKQYIYHPDWTAQRQAKMFERLPDFGATVPRLRSWIARSLRGEIGAFDTTVAAALAMIDRYSLRVGSPAYTEENGSYGTITLRPEHFQPDETTLRLAYTAKGGREVEKRIQGARLTHVLEATRDISETFALTWYRDGETVPLLPEHLNARIADLCGTQASAKTIRTWNGTHAAFLSRIRSDLPTIGCLAEAAAERLHNTPTIARNSYIHPAVLDNLDQCGAQTLSSPTKQFVRIGENELVAYLRKRPPSLT